MYKHAQDTKMEDAEKEVIDVSDNDDANRDDDTKEKWFQKRGAPV